jgi:hypothetical protein
MWIDCFYINVLKHVGDIQPALRALDVNALNKRQRCSRTSALGFNPMPK